MSYSCFKYKIIIPRKTSSQRHNREKVEQVREREDNWVLAGLSPRNGLFLCLMCGNYRMRC